MYRGEIGALVANNYIEILNDPDHLVKVVTNSLLLHNLVAVTVSKDSPISVSASIEFIPSALEKILK